MLHNGKPGYPWLVFLHGFSGDCREWQAVGESLRDYPRLYLDLPGHGESASVSVARSRAAARRKDAPATQRLPFPEERRIS